MIVNARVVPGIEGKIDESTICIFFEPKGRPNVSVSFHFLGLVFIGKAPPKKPVLPGSHILLNEGKKDRKSVV